jgi:hypothetical protein
MNKLSKLVAIRKPMNKRAVETLVAYVLLIGIGIAMAGAVYAWLKFYVANPLPVESCPDVNLIIKSYSCSNSPGNHTITLDIQNRGLFNVSGFYAKMNDVPESATGGNIAGKYPLSPRQYSKSIAPAETITQSFRFDYFSTLAQIEIEPFILSQNQTSLCEKAIVRQSIECNP